MKLRPGQKEENIAFSASDSKVHSKKSVECFNWHKKGHYKADCWAPRGGKEGQGPSLKGKGKGKATAAAAKEKPKEDEKEEAWFMNAEANITDFISEGLDIFAGLPDGESDCTSSVEEPPSDHSDDLNDLFEDSDSLSTRSL
ncbi:hypothetical protein L208DRAFT_1378501 [Tricholoma matsutake]|nr:hypothetical protein L208DRAFT_1378501 [Tricholoma matsutake 945]